MSSITASNAWTPDAQRPKMRPFISALPRVSREKLNPQNQRRNTTKQFDIESITGTSFNWRGGTEYCQPRKSRHMVAIVLHSRWMRDDKRKCGWWSGILTGGPLLRGFSGGWSFSEDCGYRFRNCTHHSFQKQLQNVSMLMTLDKQVLSTYWWKEKGEDL